MAKSERKNTNRTDVQRHSQLYTEQLIYISALSKLRESAEISAVTQI